MCCVVVEGASSVAHAGASSYQKRVGWGEAGAEEGSWDKLRELRSVNPASMCLGRHPWLIVCAGVGIEKTPQVSLRSISDGRGKRLVHLISTSTLLSGHSGAVCIEEVSKTGCLQVALDQSASKRESSLYSCCLHFTSLHLRSLSWALNFHSKPNLPTPAIINLWYNSLASWH